MPKSKKPLLSVFVSFSQTDYHLVHVLKARLSELGANTIIAIELTTPGCRLDDKIKRLIRDAHVIVVLLTRNTINSQWVQQEIGYAMAKSRPILPLKVKAVPAPAMLEGLEYLSLTLSNPGKDFERLTRYLAKFAEENGFRLATSNEAIDDRSFTIAHLPEARICPDCKHIDVHVFICFHCGEWVCTECGAIVPVSATVR